MHPASKLSYPPLPRAQVERELAECKGNTWQAAQILYGKEVEMWGPALDHNQELYVTVHSVREVPWCVTPALRTPVGSSARGT